MIPGRWIDQAVLSLMNREEQSLSLMIHGKVGSKVNTKITGKTPVILNTPVVC